MTAAYPAISYTWSQSLTLIKQLIAGLRAHPSFSPGCTILIHSLNTALYPILILSIIGAGAISAHTNPAYTQYELEHVVRITRARLVLCEPEDTTLKPMMKAMRANKLNPSRDLLVLDTLPTQFVPHFGPPLKSWQLLLEHGSEQWTTFSSPDKSKTTTAALFLSSGTTGLPKAAALTHHNLISQHQLIYAPYTDYRARTYSTSPRKSPGMTTMAITLPMFHIGVSNLTFVTGVKDHRTTIMIRQFNTLDFLDTVSKFQCNESVLVPPIVNAIISLADRDHASETLVKQKLSSVRFVLLGAAPTGPTQQARLQELMGWTPQAIKRRRSEAHVGQLWGMTETSCIVSQTPPQPSILDQYDYHGSVGWAMPGVEMRVFDPTTLQPKAKPGEEGEIWVRSPTVMKGYFGREDESDSDNETFVTFDNVRWLRSGDLGRQSPETGLWTIVGRVKELIKVRGFQVSPAEVEACVRLCPGVVDVAVIGVPAKRKGDGEDVRAFVARDQDSESGRGLTEGKVYDWVKGRLSRVKWLEGGVGFVEQIPRNATGKILRRVLKERVEKNVGAGGANLVKGSKL